MVDSTIKSEVRYNFTSKRFEGWDGEQYQPVDDNMPVKSLVYTVNNFSTVPEHATNAAAKTAGLVVGDLFRVTTTGEAVLHIVV